MNGPDHYREGEALLALCGDVADGTDQRANIAVEAQAHFLAALTVAVVTSQHRDSISWQQAINPPEQP
ncbi:hypothetical protein [Streptomyces spinosirectus]